MFSHKGLFATFVFNIEVLVFFVVGFGFSLLQTLASKRKMESQQQCVSTSVFMYDCWGL
jgi:hypothetical protein